MFDFIYLTLHVLNFPYWFVTWIVNSCTWIIVSFPFPKYCKQAKKYSEFCNVSYLIAATSQRVMCKSLQFLNCPSSCKLDPCLTKSRNMWKKQHYSRKSSLRQLTAWGCLQISPKASSKMLHYMSQACPRIRTLIQF